MGMQTIESIRMIVAAINANGEPDFYFCKVRCNPEQYANGDHYEFAEKMAVEEGYEPRLAYDEYDLGGKAILDHFVWNTASEFTV